MLIAIPAGHGHGTLLVLDERILVRVTQIDSAKQAWAEFLAERDTSEKFWTWQTIDFMPTRPRVIRLADDEETQRYKEHLVVEWAMELAEYWDVQEWGEMVIGMLTTAEAETFPDPTLYRTVIDTMINVLRKPGLSEMNGSSLPPTTDEPPNIIRFPRED